MADPYHRDDFAFDARVEARAEASGFDDGIPYVLHSDLTRGLHQEWADTPVDALEQWAEANNITGRVLGGRARMSPFEHYEVALKTAGVQHVVSIVRTETLTRGDFHV